MGEKGRAQRERVLDAALEVMAERGLAATRISDIAEAAGMSPGHVLYYFGNRDGIFLQALRHVEDRMHEEAEAELSELEPGGTRLRRLLELNLPDGLADPTWTLWLEAWSLAPHDETVRDLVGELEDRWIRLLADVVRSGLEAGAFACDDVDAVVASLYAAVNGFALQVVTGLGGIGRADALEACVALAEVELGTVQPARR